MHFGFRARSLHTTGAHRLLCIPPGCRVQTRAGTDHQSVYIRLASLTSSLGTRHSTTELLPRASVYRYLTVQQGLSGKDLPVFTACPYRLPNPSKPWGLIAKWTVKRTVNPSSKPALTNRTCPTFRIVLCHFTTSSTYHNGTPTSTGGIEVFASRRLVRWGLIEAPGQLRDICPQGGRPPALGA